ncbi:hypothetical protein AcW1_002958 [Taiwanofungus camphoratus]|nr:hypothetical protein AcW1_002958 [Antrodia cinnamomea]
MTSSNGGTISTKEVIAYSEYLQLSAYCQMAACALVFYEHLTTFSQEIHLVWNHKITGAAITLLVNRYLVLIYGIINVFSVINWTTSSRS